MWGVDHRGGGITDWARVFVAKRDADKAKLLTDLFDDETRRLELPNAAGKEMLSLHDALAVLIRFHVAWEAKEHADVLEDRAWRDQARRSALKREGGRRGGLPGMAESDEEGGASSTDDETRTHRRASGPEQRVTFVADPAILREAQSRATTKTLNRDGESMVARAFMDDQLCSVMRVARDSYSVVMPSCVVFDISTSWRVTRRRREEVLLACGLMDMEDVAVSLMGDLREDEVCCELDPFALDIRRRHYTVMPWVKQLLSDATTRFERK